MKIMKKLLSVVLAAMMLCSLFVGSSITASAADTSSLRVELTQVANWGRNSIRLKWNKVSGVSGYKIYESVDNIMFYSVATLKQNVTEYTTDALDPDTTYYYKVNTYTTTKGVFKDTTTYGESSETVVRPAKPSISSTAKCDGIAYFCVNVDSVPGADGYEINVWDQLDLNILKQSETTSLCVNNLPRRNGAYIVQIRAYYQCDNGTKIYSPWTNQHAVRIGDTGWVKEKDKSWYYLDFDGFMAINAWVRDSVDWCYLGSDGKMATNKWVKDSVDWCYLGSNGRIVRNAWVQDSAGWCYVGADGRIVRNDWVQDSVGWCWIDSSGHWTGLRY